MIGVFDSGLGGLSIWRELEVLLPNAPIVYLADQAHLPYGERPVEEVQQLALRCTRWLIERGCTTVVVACNTASANALELLRQTFPNTPFVGVEPAIKPAAQRTRSGVVGVLATTATLRSARFQRLVAQWSKGAQVLTQPCPTWVQLVEEGLRDPRLGDHVQRCLMPLVERNADTFVIACTHFSFLASWIHEALTALAPGRDCAVIDPALAVARQVVRVHAPPAVSERLRQFWTTGDPVALSRTASFLLGRPIKAYHAAL